MLLVRKAWARSFTQVESNTRDIKQRGIDPLTYILLDHVELQTEGREDVNQALGDAHFRAFNERRDRIDPVTLNLGQGYAGDCIKMVAANENRKREKEGLDPVMVADEKCSLSLKRIKEGNKRG
jgi:hypothetical protein